MPNDNNLGVRSYFANTKLRLEMLAHYGLPGLRKLTVSIASRGPEPVSTLLRADTGSAPTVLDNSTYTFYPLIGQWLLAIG